MPQFSFRAAKAASSNPDSHLQGSVANFPTTNLFTDAPASHRGLILGGLQLIFWLFCHPSAWRNHLAGIAPDLAADFALADLKRQHWRNPALRRLLIQAFLVWPLLTAVLLLPLVSWWNMAPEDFFVNLAILLAGGLTGSLTIGALVNVGGGIVFGAAVSLLSILSGALVATLPTLDPLAGEAIMLAGLVGLVGHVAGNIADRSGGYSVTRQVGSVVIGVTISAILLVGILAIVNRGGELVGGGLTSILLAALIFVLLLSFTFGLAVGWRAQNWRRGLAGGLVSLVIIGLVGGLVLVGAARLQAGILFLSLVGVLVGLAAGLLFSALFALPYLLAEPLAGPWAGAIAGSLGSCGVYITFSVLISQTPTWPTLTLALIVILAGLTLGWWRPILFYPLLAAWHLSLYRADERRQTGVSYLRWHAAFWDEFQRLPFTGLDEHLLLVAERNPLEGARAIAYLAGGPHRRAAQAAQIALDVRTLAACNNLAAVGQLHHQLGSGDLAGPAGTLLRSFSRLSQDIDAALRQESAYNQRLALSAVEDRLDSLLRELTRSDEPYAPQFQPVAAHWRQLIAAQIRALAEAVEARQEIDNPYIIGVPLTDQQAIFVGRGDISARIEQLLLDRRSPPLLLYGQRRMGKTSLLNNLGRLLPSTIIPLFVDLQGPASRASDHAGFLYNLARSMVDSARRRRNLALPLLSRESLIADPFTAFDEWLDAVEAALAEPESKTALLTVDEFEALDGPLADGRFDEAAILGMFRNLIQHRPRFKILLAGSHTLDEFQRWAGYLINVQTVHIGYLSETEARQLLERPVPDFALRYEPAAADHILALTRRHPALLQLLAAEVVALKNEQDPAERRLATLADVEAAIPEALRHGSFFFADIERNQVDETGTAILRYLAAQGEAAIVNRADLAEAVESQAQFDDTLDLLIRRELIEPVAGGYRFQVELIRRWFEA